VHIDFNVNSTFYYEDISREVLRGINQADHNKITSYDFDQD